MNNLKMKLYYYHQPLDQWLHVETLPFEKALQRLEMFRNANKKAKAMTAKQTTTREAE
jgi:hypothetical protein